MLCWGPGAAGCRHACLWPQTGRGGSPATCCSGRQGHPAALPACLPAYLLPCYSTLVRYSSAPHAGQRYTVSMVELQQKGTHAQGQQPNVHMPAAVSHEHRPTSCRAKPWGPFGVAGFGPGAVSPTSTSQASAAPLTRGLHARACTHTARDRTMDARTRTRAHSRARPRRKGALAPARIRGTANLRAPVCVVPAPPPAPAPGCYSNPCSAMHCKARALHGRPRSLSRALLPQRVSASSGAT